MSPWYVRIVYEMPLWPNLYAHVIDATFGTVWMIITWADDDNECSILNIQIHPLLCGPDMYSSFTAAML